MLARSAAVEKAGGPASADVAGGAFRAGTVAKFGNELPDTITQLYNKVDSADDLNWRIQDAALSGQSEENPTP